MRVATRVATWATFALVLPLAACRSDPGVTPGVEELPAPAPSAPRPPTSFAGNYSSTEGPATIAESGSLVTITYKRGFATCTAAGRTLGCTWHEGKNYGQATITQHSDGKIYGTWGVGKSASDGGEWAFVPTGH